MKGLKLLDYGLAVFTEENFKKSIISNKIDI